ncbi:MAG: hypothetical protein ACP5SH_25440 [Syntrophobacteraceae bacterium]
MARITWKAPKSIDRLVIAVKGWFMGCLWRDAWAWAVKLTSPKG